MSCLLKLKRLPWPYGLSVGWSKLFLSGLIACRLRHLFAIQILPLRGKEKRVRTAPTNRILVPFNGSFQHFRRPCLSSLYGSLPGHFRERTDRLIWTLLSVDFVPVFGLENRVAGLFIYFYCNLTTINQLNKSGLKTGVENGMFWSEIWSGFGEPGGTPLPKIPRSTPPPPWDTAIRQLFCDCYHLIECTHSVINVISPGAVPFQQITVLYILLNCKALL